MNKKFKRAKQGRRVNADDKVGTVRVQVSLKRGGHLGGAVRGNIIRSFSVADSKVSVVVDAIEQALFHG